MEPSLQFGSKLSDFWFHIQISLVRRPFFVRFYRDCANETQATGLVGERPQEVRSSLDLFIEALEHVRAF